jgi:hypothetical protein
MQIQLSLCSPWSTPEKKILRALQWMNSQNALWREGEEKRRDGERRAHLGQQIL